MPDITKCTGEECPLKKFCWRFTSEPDKVQSWMSPPGQWFGGGDHGEPVFGCDHFVKE